MEDGLGFGRTARRTGKGYFREVREGRGDKGGFLKFLGGKSRREIFNAGEISPCARVGRGDKKGFEILGAQSSREIFIILVGDREKLVAVGCM